MADVLMVHKDFKDREPARVTEQAFEKVWKDNGWVKLDPKSKEAQAATSTPLEADGPAEDEG